MAARASGKKKKSASKATKKSSAKKGPAKKSTKKAAAKKTVARTSVKATKKKAAAPRKPTTAKAAVKTTPPGSGTLVHTRLVGISKRLLGPSTTAGGESASGGISYTNPARSAMLRRLLG